MTDSSISCYFWRLRNSACNFCQSQKMLYMLKPLLPTLTGQSRY